MTFIKVCDNVENILLYEKITMQNYIYEINMIFKKEIH